MSVDGAWEGDPESTPCEMGGGPLEDSYTDTHQPAGTHHGHGRFVESQGDRVYDRTMDVYYIRERLAVEKLNAKLERAAKMVETGIGAASFARRIRALKENV